MTQDANVTVEAYFAERDAEARERLRRAMEAKAEEAANRQELGRLTGLTEEAVAEHFLAIGFTRDSADILHLLPLVEVAWADGQVSDAERQAILWAAASHGVEPGSEGGRMLAALLEDRPSQTLLDQILLCLHQVIELQGVEPAGLVEACRQVAQASGGFLGIGSKINDAEQATIEKLSASFSEQAKEKVRAAYEAQG